MNENRGGFRVLKAIIPWFVIAVLMLMSGIGSGYAGAQDIYAEQAVISTNGVGVVTPSGGKVVLNGASVSFLPESVAVPVTVSLTRMAPERLTLALPEILSPAGDFYIFSSDMLIFGNYVEVRLPYDPTRVSPGELADVDIYIWNGRDFIAIPTEKVVSDHFVKGYIREILNDGKIPSDIRPQDTNFSMGFYVLKQDRQMVASGCSSSGGQFNGSYCECPWGQGWSQWKNQCIRPGFYPQNGGNSGPGYKTLTANLGNVALGCSGDYKGKLCYSSTEGRIRDSLSTLNPDIVALQETFPVEKCTEQMRQDQTRICSITSPYIRQIDRLLPPTVYEIRCTDLVHGGYECTGVKRSILLGLSDRIDRDEYPYEAGCEPEKDTGGFRTNFSLITGEWFALINGHTAAPEKSDSCRAEQIRRMFQLADETGRFALIMGDMNMDPYFPADCPIWNPWDVSAAEWRTHIFPDGAYNHHNNLEDRTVNYAWPCDQPYTFDHIVSNFANGQDVVCQTLHDVNNLDQGAGMDHDAVWCPELIFPDLAPPETTITSNPDLLTASRTAYFSFTSTEPNSSFRCKLDAQDYTLCNSPVTYEGLGPGQHTFFVFSVDPVGNADLTPASYQWTIAGTVTTLRGPNNPPSSMSASRGQQDVPMLQLLLTAGSLEDVRASRIRLTASGDGNDATHISRVRVWLDVDGNGVRDSADIPLGTGVYPADNGVATISLERSIPKGTSERWLVTYDLKQTLAFSSSRRGYTVQRRQGAAPIWLVALLSPIFVPIGLLLFCSPLPRLPRLPVLFLLFGSILTLTTCGGGGGGGPSSVTYKYTVSLANPTDLSLTGIDSGHPIQPAGSFPITGTTLSVPK